MAGGWVDGGPQSTAPSRLSERRTSAGFKGRSLDGGQVASNVEHVVFQRHQVGGHLRTGTCGKIWVHWLFNPHSWVVGNMAPGPVWWTAWKPAAHRLTHGRLKARASFQHGGCSLEHTATARSSTGQQPSPAQTWAAGRGSSCGRSGTCGSAQHNHRGWIRQRAHTHMVLIISLHTGRLAHTHWQM